MPAAARQPAARYGSAAQLAAFAGVSVKTIRRMIARGDVRGLKIGRRTLVPFADVTAYMEGSSMATIHRPEPTEGRPLVPPIDPAELQRRNRAAAALLDRWMAEGDEDEQTAALDVLREALGKNRVLSSRPAL